MVRVHIPSLTHFDSTNPQKTKLFWTQISKFISTVPLFFLLHCIEPSSSIHQIENNHLGLAFQIGEEIGPLQPSYVTNFCNFVAQQNGVSLFLIQ